MITNFNTPVRELDGNIFVAVEELYKRDEIIEQLKKELTEEKKASIRMYNQYTEVKERIDKAIEYIKSELYWCTDNVYTMNMVDLEKLVDILKGEYKEC